MDIIKQLEERYATKKFDSTKRVSDDKIKKLEKAFQLTPTSFNLQPMKLVILENKEVQEKLVPYAFDQRQVADASHLLVLCIDKAPIKSQIEEKFAVEKAIRNTSDEVLNKFKNALTDRLTNMSDKELEIMMKHQIYLVLGTLLTVASAEEIECCPMQGFIPEKFDEILNLKERNLKSVLLLPVGYRSEDDFISRLPKVRKPLEKLIVKL